MYFLSQPGEFIPRRTVRCFNRFNNHEPGFFKNFPDGVVGWSIERGLGFFQGSDVEAVLG